MGVGDSRLIWRERQGPSVTTEGFYGHHRHGDGREGGPGGGGEGRRPELEIRVSVPVPIHALSPRPPPWSSAPASFESSYGLKHNVDVQAPPQTKHVRITQPFKKSLCAFLMRSRGWGTLLYFIIVTRLTILLNGSMEGPQRPRNPISWILLIRLHPKADREVTF